MADDFEQILDHCIDRINHGEKAEDCLADYPEQAAQLGPLLRTGITTGEAYTFIPSADTKRAARQKFLAALEKQRKPSFWQRIMARPLVWATAAAVLVVILIGAYFGLRMTVPSVEPPTVAVTAPNPNGNFIFLVSDEVNALSEFNHLYIDVEKIDLLQSGGSAQLVSFVPEVKQFDLTLLPGAITQQLWQGNLPEGQYTKARIFVSAVRGILKSDGNAVDIKVPSNKIELEIQKPFQISADNITSFTYDLTVINTGKGNGGERYQLKPQANQSGANQSPNPNRDKSNGNKAAATPDTSIAPTVNNNRKK
jgi:hypothetical protein